MNLFGFKFFLVLYLTLIGVFLGVFLLDVFSGVGYDVGFLRFLLFFSFIPIFSWVGVRVFSSSNKLLSDFDVVIVIAFSVVIAIAFQYIMVDFSSSASLKKVKFNNPLYARFIEISKEHGLDLSFTKEVWEQRGPVNYKVNEIFKYKKGSLDVVFFGDSSLAWGVIPSVIESISNKKVAVYAYESNALTVKSAKLFKRLADYYLKPDGVAVFSFDRGLLDKDADYIPISKNEYSQIMAWTDSDFSKYARENEIGFYDEYLSYDAFSNLFDSRSEMLKVKYGLKLKSPSFYLDYVEPVLNYRWHHLKSENLNDKVRYLRWGMDTVTEYSEEFNNFSMYSDSLPLNPIVNSNLQLNAESAGRVFDGRKVYMVPLFYHNNSYVVSRNFYYTYYETLGFGLADLGLLHPKSGGYPMDLGSHMGNEGGLMKSILIGYWLKNYLSGKNNFMPNPFKPLFKEYLKISEYLISYVPSGGWVYLPEKMRLPVVLEFFKKNKINVVDDLEERDEFYFSQSSVDDLKGYAFSSVGGVTVSEYVKGYSDSLVVLSISDEGWLNLSNETKTYLKGLGVPIEKLKYRGSLAVVINGGELIEYGLNNNAMVVLESDALLRLGVNKVISAGRLLGNESKIFLSGKNHSKGRRGINIVVKSPGGHILSTVADTFSLDQVKISMVYVAHKK